MSIRVILTYLALSLSVAFAQTSESRYMAGLSAVFADYNGPLTGDITQVKAFNPGISVGAYAYISSWFNVSLNSSFFPEVIYPIGGGEFGGSSLTDVTALTQIKFNNGRLLSESAFLAPYLTTGFGFNMASGQTGYYLPAGLGMKMAVSKNFSLQFESLYKQALNSRVQHIAHTVGFVFALPNESKPVRKPTPPQRKESQGPLASNDPAGKDSDGDGVPDARDHCPDLAGKAMYLGCPAPAEDKPERKETAMQVATQVSTAIDTDGDGILDKDDRCPEMKGLITNDGCPKATGVAIEDNKPESTSRKVAQVDITPAEQQYLKDAMRMIHFESGSKELASSNYPVLDKVAEIMNRYPTYHLIVKGHTDNTGSEKGNLVLSIQRAFEVKYYLAHQKGIRLARIESDGAADADPIADNVSDEGRKQNRRVEFTLYAPGANNNIADSSKRRF